MFLKSCHQFVFLFLESLVFSQQLVNAFSILITRVLRGKQSHYSQLINSSDLPKVSEGQTDKLVGRLTHRWTDRLHSKVRDKQTGRQKERKTDREAGRQRDRQEGRQAGQTRLTDKRKAGGRGGKQIDRYPNAT